MGMGSSVMVTASLVTNAETNVSDQFLIVLKGLKNPAMVSAITSTRIKSHWFIVMDIV